MKLVCLEFYLNCGFLVEDSVSLRIFFSSEVGLTEVVVWFVKWVQGLLGLRFVERYDGRCAEHGY